MTDGADRGAGRRLFAVRGAAQAAANSAPAILTAAAELIEL